MLELAPGFGRATQYLKELCDRLIVVDLSERCIAACRERFAAAHNIEYHINDGTSLAMVPERAIDSGTIPSPTISTSGPPTRARARSRTIAG